MKEHCWHHTGIENLSMPPSHDETCCWCGTTRHVSRRYSNAGHGQYTPSVLTVEHVSGDDYPCIEREAVE